MQILGNQVVQIVCKQELETTEHLFECEAVGRMIGKYSGKSIIDVWREMKQ